MTVSDLGKKLKVKHPRKFGHLTDAEAGRQAKAEFPEHYGHYEEEGLTVIPQLSDDIKPFYTPQREFTGLVGTNQQIDLKIQKLWDKHDPQMGTVVGWLRRQKVEAQNRYLVQANEQQRLLIEQAVAVTEAIIKGRKAEQELQLFLVNNHKQIVEMQVWGKLLVDAANEGLSIAGLEEKRTAEYEAQIRKQENEALYNRDVELARIAIDKATNDAKLKLNEYKEKTTHDLNNEIRLAQEQLRLDIIAKHLNQQQQISFIQDLIEEQHIKISEVRKKKELTDGEIEAIVKSRQRIIEMYEQQQMENQNRILQPRQARSTEL